MKGVESRTMCKPGNTLSQTLPESYNLALDLWLLSDPETILCLPGAFKSSCFKVILHRRGFDPISKNVSTSVVIFRI